MNTVHSEFIRADNILKKFVEEDSKFEERFTALLTDMNDFITKSGFEGKVIVNELILGYALVDYFEDVRRLKSFHKMDHINSIKIVSYTAYWLLRRQPMQIIEQRKELLYVNERFVLAYILGFLNDQNKGKILERDNAGLKSFMESLLYHFKYRAVNANYIEMIIAAFLAGEIYQNEEEDLSSRLSQYDIE